jgi:hypothetical protein
VNDLNRNLDDAAGAPPVLDLGALHDRATARRRRRRATVAGTTLAAGVLVIGVAVGLTGGGEPAPTGQVTAAQGIDSSTTTDPSVSSTTGPGTTIESDPTSTTSPPTSSTSSEPDPLVTTSTVPPVSPPPTAGPRGFSITGTFEGTTAEAFTIDPARCPQIVSELDATMTTSRGETWLLHEDGCGELHDDFTRYAGAGPFTISAGSGDTLSGTYVSNAPLPTDGEPYTLTITGGTGEWAGATGTCDLDNQMETLPGGGVRQFGTFTCSVALGAELG